LNALEPHFQPNAAPRDLARAECDCGKNAKQSNDKVIQRTVQHVAVLNSMKVLDRSLGTSANRTSWVVGIGIGTGLHVVGIRPVLDRLCR